MKTYISDATIILTTTTTTATKRTTTATTTGPRLSIRNSNGSKTSRRREGLKSGESVLPVEINGRRQLVGGEYIFVSLINKRIYLAGVCGIKQSFWVLFDGDARANINYASGFLLMTRRRDLFRVR